MYRGRQTKTGTKTMKASIKEIKKLDSGDFAVLWAGSKRWALIKKEDSAMIEFAIYYTLTK
jgi:hypothetical protein